MDFDENIKKNLWSKLTEMITGPEHEYVYLRRIINKMKEYYKREDNQEFKRMKKLKMQKALEKALQKKMSVFNVNNLAASN